MGGEGVDVPVVQWHTQSGIAGWVKLEEVVAALIPIVRPHAGLELSQVKGCLGGETHTHTHTNTQNQVDGATNLDGEPGISKLSMERLKFQTAKPQSIITLNTLDFGTAAP